MSDKYENCFVRNFRKPGVVELSERYQYQYPIIMKYLLKKIDGKNVVDGFKILKSDKIALYSVTEFTKMICDDLHSTDDDGIIKCVCDKGAGSYPNGYKGHKVVNLKELVMMCESNEIEKIVICNVFREHEIIDELVGLGIDLGKMVHIIDILFWM